MAVRPLSTGAGKDCQHGAGKTRPCGIDGHLSQKVLDHFRP
jgi:hypothetical protein